MPLTDFSTLSENFVAQTIKVASQYQVGILAIPPSYEYALPTPSNSITKIDVTADLIRSRFFFSPKEDLILDSASVVSNLTHDVVIDYPKSDFMKSVRHDTILSHYTVKFANDVALKEIIELDDDSDRMTPDVIFLKDGIYVVLEFKSVTVDGDALNVYDKALHKYQPELMKRVRSNQIIFFVCVVGPSTIVTNLPFDSAREGFAIASLYALGAKAYTALTSAGYDPRSQDSTKIKAEFDDMMSRIDNSALPINGSLPLISQEMVSEWERIVREKDFDEADYKRRVFGEAMKEAKQGMKNPKEEIISSIQKHRELVASYPQRKSLDCRVLGFALFYAKHEVIRVTNMTIPQVKYPSGALGELWSGAFHYARTQATSTLSEWSSQFRPEDIVNYALGEEEIDRLDRERSDNRRKRFKVAPILTMSSRLELAMTGVEAKQFEGNAVLKERDDDKSRNLPLDLDTSDIDEFVMTECKKLLEFGGADCSMHRHEVDQLIKQAHSYVKKFDIEGNSSDIFCETWRHTKMHSILSFFSFILEEMNLSLQSFCQPGEFLLKHPTAGMWLLIKPTSVDKHIFCSILLAKTHFHAPEEFRKMGREFHETEDHYLVPFFSMNREKIGWLIGIHIRMGTHLAYLQELFEGKIIPANESNERIASHFAIMILLDLRSAPKIDTELGNVRYIQVQLMGKSPVTFPTPHHILDKMTKQPRNKLHVWIYNRILYLIGLAAHAQIAFDEVADDNPITDATVNEQNAEHGVKNFTSFIDGLPLTNFRQVLHLSYLYALRNKADADRNHGTWAILDKIIDTDASLEHSDFNFIGLKDDYERKYGPHEFSIKTTLLAATEAKKYIETIRPGAFTNVFDTNIIGLIRQNTLSKVSTFKSSLIHPESFDTDHFIEEMERIIDEKVTAESKRIRKKKKAVLRVYETRKVAENVWNEIFKDETFKDPYILIMAQKFLEDVEKMGYILSSEFPKDQHGKSREIHVLEVKSRLLTLCMESLSRAVASMFPEEMLTKGESKMNKMREHEEESRKHIARDESDEIRVSMSDDASTWGPNFMMPQFGAVMFVLLPKKYHNFFFRALNLFSKKRMIIPNEIINIFLKKPDQEGFSGSMERLKRQFYGTILEGERQLVPYARATYMEIVSGMMQGILHYTSTVYAVCMGVLYRKWIKDFLTLAKKHLNEDGNHGELISWVVTFLVSSDDSLCQVSAFGRNLTNKHYLVLSACRFIKIKVMQLMGTKHSREKSAALFNYTAEFNQIWAVRGTFLFATIKFIETATILQVTYSLVDQQILMGNARRQVSENHGSTQLCDIIQKLGSRVHYIMLGQNISPIFKEYSELLLTKPHPAMGLFLFEPMPVAGIFGYDLAHYIYTSEEPKAMGYEAMLYSVAGGDYTENGGMTVRPFVDIGGKKKYKAFRDRTQVEGFDEVAKNEPEVFFSNQTSYRGEVIVTQAKFRVGSTALAFKRNTASIAHTIALYRLWEKVVTVVYNIAGEKRIKKMSMYKFLHDFGAVVTPENKLFKEIMFPLAETYNLILRICTDYTKAAIVDHKEFASRPITISVPRMSVTGSLTLMEVVQYVWFEMPVRGAKSEKDRNWQVYQAMYPWLRRSPAETLAESPFLDYIGLSTFIKSLRPATISFKVVTPVRRGLPLAVTISRVISRSYGMRQSIHFDRTEKKSDAYHSPLSEYYTKQLLVLSGPKDNTKILRDFVIVSQEADLSGLQNSTTGDLDMNLVASLSARDKALLVFIEYAKGRDIYEAVTTSKRGVWGYYSQRQKWTKGVGYSGLGTWVGIVEDFTIRISIMDNEISLIETSSLRKLAAASKQIRQLLGELWLQQAAEGSEKIPNVDAWWNFISNKFVLQGSVDRNFVPVRKVDSIHVARFSNTGQKTDLRIRESNVAIMMQLIEGDKNRLVTVFSYTFDPLFFNNGEFGDSALLSKNPSLFMFWMRNQSISPDTISQAILSIRKEVESGNLSRVHTLEWIKKTFRMYMSSKMRNLSMASIFKISASEVEILIDDELEEAVSPMDDSELDAIFDDMDEDLDEPLDLSGIMPEDNALRDFLMEDADVEDITVVMSTLERVITRESTLPVLHNFWVNVGKRIMLEHAQIYSSLVLSETKIPLPVLSEESDNRFLHALAILTDNVDRPSRAARVQRREEFFEDEFFADD